MCKDVVIEMVLMRSQVNLHEDVPLQSELPHAFDVLMDEPKNVEMPYQSDVKSIVAYVEVSESTIFKSTLVSQLNGNPTLSEDWLTWIKANILYMKPKLITVANHDTTLDLNCDCGVCFLNTLEAIIVQKYSSSN